MRTWTRAAPAGAWGTRARRNSVGSTVACSERRRSVMSRACGLLRLLAPPSHVKRSRGPRLVEPLHAIDRLDRRSYPDELMQLLAVQRSDREELAVGTRWEVAQAAC